MKIVNCKDIPLEPVSEEGANGVKVRWVIKNEDGAERFAMRIFYVEPGGYTPCHAHPWEHEVYVLEGEGEVLREGEWKIVSEGSVLFIPPNEEHQFKNGSNRELVFICLVPYLH